MSRFRYRGLALGAIAGVGMVVLLQKWRASRRPGRLAVPSIGDQVQISRNGLGIPHIVARNHHDALFGLGYAVAEDRLIQLHLVRRLAAGRLSEISGPAMLESDRLMRLIGMERIARRLVETLDPETLQALEAYAAGVNQFLSTVRRPVESRLAGFDLEPWLPADSLLIMRLLGWGLGGDHLHDLVAQRVRETIGDEWADAIYGSRVPDRPPIARDFVMQGPAKTDPANLLSLFPSHGASNTWAVGPQRSVTGAPLLANDPHLELTNPSVWMEAAVETPDHTVAGVTLPGFPGITIGRSNELAWGLTAGMIAQIFLYQEEFVDGEFQVRNGDELEDVMFRDEVIQVKGTAPEVLRVRSTPRGPLISDLYPDLSDGPISLHWTGAEASNEFGLFLTANSANSVQELIEHRNHGTYAIPTLNAALADGDGNIAMVSYGRYPVRSQRSGALPVSEFPPAYIQPNQLPIEVNPERGWVACANNTVVGPDYPYEIRGHWDPGYRYRRICEELESRPKHSVADMRALQLDQHSARAAELVGQLVGLIEGRAPLWAVDDLQGWDYQVDADSRPALLFHVFDRIWSDSVLKVHIPEPLAARMQEVGPPGGGSGRFTDQVLIGAMPGWMSHEGRRELAIRSFDAALEWIEEQLGNDYASWNWGAVHQLTFVHPLGMVGGPHQRRVNVGPFAVGGDNTTVRPFAWRGNEPYQVFAGASMRFVTDLRDPSFSWMTNTLGQSGFPLSRHFRDQVGDYLIGRMHEIWPDVASQRKTMTLVPND